MSTLSQPQVVSTCKCGCCFGPHLHLHESFADYCLRFMISLPSGLTQNVAKHGAV